MTLLHSFLQVTSIFRRSGSLRPARLLLLAATAVLPFLPLPAARAQIGTPLFTSVGKIGGGTGGAGAYGSVTQGTDGNFYGTTYLGGDTGAGTVFRLTANGAITVIHSFNGTDGRYPQGGLILAGDGFIYGTTYEGGTVNSGTIFRVQPASGEFQSVFSFTGTDGANPYAGLAEISGLLYGTTVSGGTGEAGTLFSFATGKAQLATLFNFDGGARGGNPEAAPIPGNDGSIYGTTATGGEFQGGSVYRYTPGTGLTVLHSFALGEPTGPAANLVLSGSGTFYGTTVSGGAVDKGAIFGITADGVLTTVYSFSGGSDGATPQSALILGSDGTLYGTAAKGGILDSGTVFSLSPAGILTVLHAFSGDDKGGVPESGLFLAEDGSLYGTTYAGGNGDGNFGNGTVYRLSFTGAPGTVQFTNSEFSTIESIGAVNLSVSRVNGTAGAISVDYATSNGTAVAGIDYTATTGTLTWAEGDSTDKTIPVRITDRGITDGSTRTVNITLSNFSGGTAGGQPTTAVLSIVDNDEQPIQPTVTFTSPPADIQVVTGSPLTIAASVTDPNAILARVQFFVNGQLFQQTDSTGPFSVSLNAPDPGTYVLGATAIDNLGRKSTATRTITVIAASETDPTPATNILTDLDGRTLAAGTTFTFSASATSLAPGDEPLARVDFYADDVLFASFDGEGNVIDTSGTPSGVKPTGQNVRRPAATARANATGSVATIFQANFTMPNLDKLINLLTVATTQSGRSQVSSSVTVKATTSTDNKPPQAALKGVTDGSQVNLGATLTVPVDVSDPDATTGNIPVLHARGGPRLAITPPAGIIAQMTCYLDQLKVATLTQPPFVFDVKPAAAGTHVLEAIVTDGGGLSNVAAPVLINVVAPTVSLRVGADTNKTEVTEGGPVKRVRVIREGDTSQDLTVNYKVKGSNVAGVDYGTLSGSVTIKAGSSVGKIKVRAFDDGVVDGNKLTKIQLSPATDGSYTVGTPQQVKVRIIDAQ